MSTVITAGNITNNFKLVGDGTGILEFQTGTGAGTTALTISAAQKTILACTALSTASNGMIEYNGTAFYGTPQGTQRGIMPSMQYYRLNTAYAGADVSTVQSVFGVGVTLSSSTIYEFEGLYVQSKAAGTTSHTIGYGFGGTATLNNIGYYAQYSVAAGSIPTAGISSGSGTGIAYMYSNTATNNTLSQTITAATIYQVVLVKGTVSINAGGTLIPQYTLSAAPGGAYTTNIGSFFKIYPISASGANTNVGTWA